MWSIRELRMGGTVPPAVTLPAVTLPDPFRGYAQPTWDTRTLALLIAALGGVGALAPRGVAILPTFVDVSMSAGGGTTVQTIPNGTFTRLNLDTKASDVSGIYNTTTHLYTVPATGLYFSQALVRTRDNAWTNASGDNLGVGVKPSTAATADPSFQWNKVLTTAAGGGRYSADYTRVASYNSGDQLELYVYQDSGASKDLYSAALQIYRVA